MRPRFILVIALAFTAGLFLGASLMWHYVSSHYLAAQQVRIKGVISGLDPAFVHSNDPDGRSRFLNTGQLVIFRAPTFSSPLSVFTRQMFYFRLSPRVSNDEADGYVEQQLDGIWLIKIW